MANLSAVTYVFSTFAGEQLKNLLERQHLYQKVSIDADHIVRDLPKTTARNQADFFLTLFNKGWRERFVLMENSPTVSKEPPLIIPVRNVKLFCGKCDEREAFRPLWFSDVTLDVGKKYLSKTSSEAQASKVIFPAEFQLFVLVYQCQRCESLPTTFLVKRDDDELILEGRSPIEHVELPAFIPKEERHWFRDAVIAFQTGKVLAALFYLRIFLEQFARRKTKTLGERKTGDEIMSEYALTIPENLRPTMPSLREWYDKLSEAIHGAAEDAELFDTARQKVEEHFDIRRVHKLG